MERISEMLGDQKRKVGIACLLPGIFIAVTVDGHDAIRVFIDDCAFGVHAEGADQILLFLRLVDDLTFIQLVGDLLEDFCRQLDTDSYVDLIGPGADSKGITHPFHPAAAAAPD